jgi:hypothetical protein
MIVMAQNGTGGAKLTSQEKNISKTRRRGRVAPRKPIGLWMKITLPKKKSV